LYTSSLTSWLSSISGSTLHRLRVVAERLDQTNSWALAIGVVTFVVVAAPDVWTASSPARSSR